jgi:hypothetical protein
MCVVAIWCGCVPARALAQEAGEPATAADSTRALVEKQRELEARIRELEDAKVAQEDATRRIIRDAMDKTGSQINAAVMLGGTFEVSSGWIEDPQGRYRGTLGLNTAELDFEISVTPWTLGSVILQYGDGTEFTFLTVEGDERSIDRITIDTAHVTLGDTYRLVPYMTLGRLIVPFGISTGDPVHDVLTLEDPLTVEGFEMREDAIVLGLAFPTPSRTSLPPRREPPPVRPVALNPVFGKLTRAIGYRPTPPPYEAPLLVAPPTPPPPFRAAFVMFRGDTFTPRHREGWRVKSHIGATIGYRASWIDTNVDFTSSLFDSRFLEFEYRRYLGGIGFVPGMAATVRTHFGPLPLIAEWNGALEEATFKDDLGQNISIQPWAWQVSTGWQFDWNPWMTAIGSEGTYVAFSYSESRELAGVARVIGGEQLRIGDLPRRKILVGAGEWIWPGVRIALEYSRTDDYEKDRGGTGKSADAIFSMLTYEW